MYTYYYIIPLIIVIQLNIFVCSSAENVWLCLVEVINLHVHVCVDLALFKRINSDAVGIILLCFINSTYALIVVNYITSYCI